MPRNLTRLLKGAAAFAALLLMITIYAAQARAQEPGGPPPPDGPPPQGNPEADWKNALNLSTDQMLRIRDIRERTRPEMQAINQRLRAARRALDQAIYADNVNEAEVERLARELGEAQAAEVRLRSATELSIRRVLTPEQLNTFRLIRMKRQMEAQRRRREEGGPPPPRPNGEPPLQNGINPRPQGRRGVLQRRPGF